MPHDDTFLAAYVLLLARLWQELEHMLAVLRSGASADCLQVQVEIFRLDLVLLRQSLIADRLPLRAVEGARIRAVIDQLLERCDFQQTPAKSGVRVIEGTQDLLFEEVCDLMTAAASRMTGENRESLMRDVA